MACRQTQHSTIQPIIHHPHFKRSFVYDCRCISTRLHNNAQQNIICNISTYMSIKIRNDYYYLLRYCSELKTHFSRKCARKYEAAKYTLNIQYKKSTTRSAPTLLASSSSWTRIIIIISGTSHGTQQNTRPSSNVWNTPTKRSRPVVIEAWLGFKSETEIERRVDLNSYTHIHSCRVYKSRTWIRIWV